MIDIIPLNPETMDVTDIKNSFLKYTNENGDISLNDCLKVDMWQHLIKLGIPVDTLLDWENKGYVHLEDLTYFLAMIQYFLAQPKQPGHNFCFFIFLFFCFVFLFVGCHVIVFFFFLQFLLLYLFVFLFVL